MFRTTLSFIAMCWLILIVIVKLALIYGAFWLLAFLETPSSTSFKG